MKIPPTHTDVHYRFPRLGRTLQSLIIAFALLPASDTAAQTAQDEDSLGRVITKLVLDNMPHHYHEDKDWGQQEKRWDGVKIRRDGLKLETKRRWKMVNHGTWRKYSAELIDPANEFTIAVENMRESAAGQVAFDVDFTAHLKWHARQSKWVKGVQLYSLSGDGHTHLHLKVSFTMDVALDLKKLPPDLLLHPRATAANLSIDDFRLDRISKVGGEVAQQLGRQVRSVLDEKVAEKQNKLLQKINKGIEKNQDKLRISLHDAIRSKWAKKATRLLPTPVQQALKSANQSKPKPSGGSKPPTSGKQ